MPVCHHSSLFYGPIYTLLCDMISWDDTAITDITTVNMGDANLHSHLSTYLIYTYTIHTNVSLTSLTPRLQASTNSPVLRDHLSPLSSFRFDCKWKQPAFCISQNFLSACFVQCQKQSLWRPLCMLSLHLVWWTNVFCELTENTHHSEEDSNITKALCGCRTSSWVSASSMQ